MDVWNQHYYGMNYIYLHWLSLGFKINPYSKCVANKMINGKQWTFVFYVDDNKISHVDKEVVTSIIKAISNHFGELAVSRGNKHDYLGMDIELKNGKVHVGMRGQIAEAIEWGGSQKGRMSATPATIELFNVDKQATPLDQSEAEIYTTLLYKNSCTSAREHIQTSNQHYYS